jgi:lipopolysaccharide export system permease protein
VGVALTAINLVLLAVATTVSNPRAGRSGNMMFTLFAFVLYFNLLNIGQRMVSTGQFNFGVMLVGLHGSVFLLCLLWLYKRHYNISVRAWLRAQLPSRPPANTLQDKAA